MRRPNRQLRYLYRFFRSTVYCLLFTLLSCSFEIAVTRYALVYGASNYDTADDLNYTDDDAREIADTLDAAGWVVYRIWEPTMTRQDIFNDISELAGRVNHDSSVLVYFAGHGSVDIHGTTYIIPTDENPISSPELLSWLDTLPCRNRILILDTCYSGGFVTDTGTLDAAPQDYGISDDGTGGSALLAALGSYSKLLASAFQSYDPRTPIVVTAAGSEELSWESSVYTNGVFTYFFLQSATKGDLDGNGLVTIQEAFRSAREGVERYWNSMNAGSADFLPRISGNARDVVIF
ncbi:MAG TPA: caspase family protein [Magnetospirillaceae bacterium]|nr:caspase family protein [Magnetospirillaceae bacterium]